MSLVVNGRFLGATPTGVQRVGRELLSALQSGPGAATAALEVIAPARCHDALVDRQVGAAPGPMGGLVWEQVVLPTSAGRRAIVSLANTAPVTRVRAATLVHDLLPLQRPEWFHRRMQVYARVTLGAARRAQVPVAVSQHVADVLIGRGVDADRVRVLHPAVSAHFRPADADEVRRVRARHGIDGPYVLAVGAHDPRKRTPFLVEAHRRAATARPHRLVLVGGPHPNLAEVGFERSPGVVDVGRISDDDLRALLTGASALAFPSADEGFGLPPLEAQACGTPALVSDVAALRESAGPTAVRLAPDDRDAWVDALVAAVDGALPPPTPPTRQWADAARELTGHLEALR